MIKHVSIIGLPRSGTKFIKYQLRKSPKIFSLTKSEITFHNQSNFKFLGHKFNNKEIDRSKFEKYAENISMLRKKQIIFDKNTNFCLLHKDDLERYKNYFKETRFILILRNPLDRDLSDINFQQMKKNVIFDKKKVIALLHFYNHAYKHDEIIAKFSKIFKDNFKFLFFEDLISNPVGSINSMFYDKKNLKMIDHLRPFKKERNNY